MKQIRQEIKLQIRILRDEQNRGKKMQVLTHAVHCTVPHEKVRNERDQAPVHEYRSTEMQTV